MTQIKIFAGSMLAKLQMEVNEWLKDNNHHIEVVNIQMTETQETRMHNIMITYKEFECED